MWFVLYVSSHTCISVVRDTAVYKNKIKKKRKYLVQSEGNISVHA